MSDSTNEQDLSPGSHRLTRRAVLGALGALAAAPVVTTVLAGGHADGDVQHVADFDLDEVTIAELQSAMAAGKHTSREITEKYLARIAMIDRHGPAIRAVIEINPDALTIADALDRERKEKGPRGPLHGIPVLLKDNIDTGDRMLTTAGSLALAAAPAPRDAHVAKRLRDAGAVILGKTNLSEWANIRSTRSSSGWSARGGQSKNPYVLDRNTSGSSSGSASAVAANLCVVSVGTETDGSIVSPASVCGVVGIKPTLGRVSRNGIIPIAHSQDTAGPMARTVLDAVILLNAMSGADPADNKDYGRKPINEQLDRGALRGARLGVVRSQSFGIGGKTEKVFEQALAALKREGAVLVDVEMETLGKFDNEELEVLLYELKADLNAYLAARGGNHPKTLKEVIAFNEQNADREMPYFGQELFVMAEEKGDLKTKAYLEARKKSVELSQQKGIDAVTRQHKLEALVAMTNGPAWPIDLVNGDRYTGGSSTVAAVAGYPHITVPMGAVQGLPVGLSFFGPQWSEDRLVSLAYDYEQATKMRQKPRFLSTVQE